MVSTSCASNYKQDKNSGEKMDIHIKLLDVNKNASYIYIPDATLCPLELSFLKTLFRRKILLLRKCYDTS